MPDMDVFNERGINLYQLFILLWKKKIQIILVAIVGALLAFGFTVSFITPQYKACIMFYVNNSNVSIGETKLSISQSDLTAAQSLVDTYIVILDTPETRSEISQKVGFDASYSISAEAVNSTEIFRVSVIGADREQILKVASAIGDVLPNRISDTVEGSDVRIVNHAYVQGMKISPSYSQNTMAGFMAGLVLSILMIIVIEFLDNTVKTEEYLTRQYDMPILTVVPNLHSERRSTKYYRYRQEMNYKEQEANNEKKEKNKKG